MCLCKTTNAETDKTNSRQLLRHRQDTVDNHHRHHHHHQMLINVLTLVFSTVSSSFVEVSCSVRFWSSDNTADASHLTYTQDRAMRDLSSCWHALMIADRRLHSGSWFTEYDTHKLKLLHSLLRQLSNCECDVWSFFSLYTPATDGETDRKKRIILNKAYKL